MKQLRWFARKVTLIIVAIMIGFSNVIYEEEDMIGSMGHSIENLEEAEEELLD